MRTNQWFVLGLGFFLLAQYFMYQDVGIYENLCGMRGAGKNIEDSSKILTRGDLWCINTEIYDPFIELFMMLWIVCWVNGILEWWAVRKEKTPVKERKVHER
jgi:hypothetical protein